jgi:hypothetical protein
MVRTRQEIRTDLSSAGRGNRDIDFFKGQEESPLKDTASHSPVVSTQAGHEESTGPQVRQAPRQTRDVRLTVSAPRERVEEPHQTTLARPSISYVDPMLLAQLVKTVMESMANAATPMPASPLAPIIQSVARERRRGDRPPSNGYGYIYGKYGETRNSLSLINEKWCGSRHLVFWSLGTLTGLRDRARGLVA